LAALVLLAGCPFDHGAATSRDGGGRMLDANVDAPDGSVALTCLDRWRAHSVAFDAGTLIPGVSVVGAADRDPFLSSDELTLYFDSDRGVSGSPALQWTATRTSLAATFTTPVKLAGAIDGMPEESKLVTTGDGLDAILSSDRGITTFELWEATRTQTTMAFAAPNQTHLAMVNQAMMNNFDPWMSPDGLHLYFSPAIPAGHQAIDLATRGSLAASFGAPVELTELDTAFGEGDPALTSDELVILFTSQQTGTKGMTDLWYATRAAIDEPFGAPVQLLDLDTVANEGDAQLSPDACRLYFASDRDETTYDYDLYMATMQ
jgi:hypothetical protein